MTTLVGKEKMMIQLRNHQVKCTILGFVVQNEQQLDFKKAFYSLKYEYNIHYLDISCGGQIIDDLIYLGLLDESRMTLVGQIAGPQDCNGKQRPKLWQMHSYDHHETPLVAWKGIRTYKDYLVFFRGLLQYRHLKELKC